MEGRAPDHSAGSRSPGPALRCKKTALGPCTEALLCPHPLLQQMHDHTVTQQLPMLPLAGASPGKLGSATAAIPCKRAGVCSAARLSCLLSRQPQTKTSVGSKKWVPLGKSNRCSSLRVLGTWWKAPSPGGSTARVPGAPNACSRGRLQGFFVGFVAQQDTAAGHSLFAEGEVPLGIGARFPGGTRAW